MIVSKYVATSLVLVMRRNILDLCRDRELQSQMSALLSFQISSIEKYKWLSKNHRDVSRDTCLFRIKEKTLKLK